MLEGSFVGNICTLAIIKIRYSIELFVEIIYQRIQNNTVLATQTFQCKFQIDFY